MGCSPTFERAGSNDGTTFVRAGQEERGNKKTFKDDDSCARFAAKCDIDDNIFL